MDTIRNQAKKDGFVETVFGRRLYLPDINSSNYQRRQYAERSAIKAPMQGTAADIIKKAMINLQQRLAKASMDAKIIMQVHDERVLEVKDNSLDAASKIVIEAMEKAADLDVDLKVDLGVGKNWDQAH